MRSQIPRDVSTKQSLISNPGNHEEREETLGEPKDHFALRLGLLVTLQDTPVKPPQHELPTHEVDKEDTNRQGKPMGKAHKASMLHKELRAIN